MKIVKGFACAARSNVVRLLRLPGWAVRAILVCIVLLLISWTVYFVFVRVDARDFLADISSMGRITLNGVRDLEVKDDSPLILVENAEIHFDNGSMAIWDITGLESSIQTDSPAGLQPTLVLDDADTSSEITLGLPVSGERLNDRFLWGGSVREYSVKVNGAVSRFAFIVEKSPKEDHVWTWTYHGPQLTDRISQVLMYTESFQFLRRGLSMDSFPHASTLAIGPFTGQEGSSPLEVVASSMYLIVRDFNNVSITRDGDQPILLTPRQSDQEPAFLIGLAKETQLDQTYSPTVRVYPTAPDRDGKWSGLRSQWDDSTVYAYTLNYWPVFLPSISEDLHMSVERSWSSAAGITSSQGKFRLGSDTYDFGPMDSLLVVSRAVLGNTGVGEVKFVWNNRDPESAADVRAGMELEARRAQVVMNTEGMLRTRWEQVPGEFKGAIIGAAAAFMTANVRNTVKYIDRLIQRKTER